MRLLSRTESTAEGDLQMRVVFGLCLCLLQLLLSFLLQTSHLDHSLAVRLRLLELLRRVSKDTLALSKKYVNMINSTF